MHLLKSARFCIPGTKFITAAGINLVNMCFLDRNSFNKPTQKCKKNQSPYCTSRNVPIKMMFPVSIPMMNNQLKYLLSIYFASKTL